LHDNKHAAHFGEENEDPMDVDAPPSPTAAEPSPDATRPSPMDDDDSDDNSITLDQMREKARIRREASPEAPSMTPWTGDKQEQDLVKALVSTLLQTPESAPRGPTGFAVEAIKQLGFEKEDKAKIRSFISKERLIPDEHQYAVVEVPSVTVVVPKTKCPDIFYKGPNLIVNLEDYLDKEGNVIKQVELLEGQKVTTVPEWKAYFATLGRDKRGTKKKGAIAECLSCYFSHFAVSSYSDAVLQDLQTLGVTAFPWADADGDDHEDFLGVRNHPDLDKNFLSGEKTGKKLHDDKNLALMMNERNAPTSGAPPSMERFGTYFFARKRRALVMGETPTRWRCLEQPDEH
jgi:hypothetical protein